MQTRWGFTLIELLVVVTVVSLLTIVVTYSIQEQGASTRDAQRQADLRNLQNAIELYKQRYGRYPEACDGRVESWAGEPGTNFACPGDDAEYIVGLVPEFIRSLPTDPQRNGPNSGYVYATNAAGSVYIVKARRTVESEEVTFDHAFKSCAAAGGQEICDAIHAGGANIEAPPEWCQEDDTNGTFQSSYGVWGGWADEPHGYEHNTTAANARHQTLTEDVLCLIE